MNFSIGQRVQHAYTGETLWVLREGHEQILCRTKDLREIWFYPYELKEVDNSLHETRKSNRFL